VRPRFASARGAHTHALLGGRSTGTLDRMRIATFVAASLATFTASTMATDYSTDATILETFQCPESLKDDSARLAALQEFLKWMRDRHPDWTIAKATGYRLYLLERYHCEGSLSELRSHTPARP
jgi:hypothetical protein